MREAFKIDLIPSDLISLRADRDRGSAPVNNQFSIGLATVGKNQSPDELIPWFEGNNNEPEYLIQLLIDNPVSLGLIFTKAAILAGQGLSLYRRDETGKPLRIPQQDWPEEILNFYEFNDLDSWVSQAFIDHEVSGNFFAQLVFSKGDEQGEGRKVARLYRISPEKIRALKPGKGKSNIREYVIADKFDQKTIDGYKRLPAFRYADFCNAATLELLPGSSRYNSCVFHGKRGLPGFGVYSLPQWYGARKTLELANEIPHWHIANIINQWGVRMQVSISESYFNRLLSQVNPDTEKYYTEYEVKEYLRNLLKDYCTNPANVGKVLLMRHDYDQAGNPLKDILIESIKLDLKDDAYSGLLDMINSNVTSAFGIDAALADVITNKGMSSGSEKTQAWNIQNFKSTNLRKLVLRPLEFIHKFNRWDPQLFWGFENPSLVTQDIAPSGAVSPAPANEINPQD